MSRYRVVFRVDASLQIGSGHVMRCLALATALSERGANCHFICREHPGNLIEPIRRRGFQATALPPGDPQFTPTAGPGSPKHAPWLGVDWSDDAEKTRAALRSRTPQWLVVDHYALDQRWEHRLRPHCDKLMVIDDLADRVHDCDLLLDQNLGRTRADYSTFVPASCTVLAGSRYALLRPAFAALRGSSLARRDAPRLRRVLVTMGGVDRENATGRVLNVLEHSKIPQDCEITVILGGLAPHKDKILAQAETMHRSCTVHFDVRDMAETMSAADMVICAGGGTVWECCCLGLPAFMVLLADNQKVVINELVKREAALFLGDISTLDSTLTAVLSRPDIQALLEQLSRKCSQLVDGAGVSRVLEMMLITTPTALEVRAAEKGDELLLLEWANDPRTRMNSLSPAVIPRDVHHQWFAQRLNDDANCRMYIVSTANDANIGQARFERNEEGIWEVDYSLSPQFRGRGLGRLLLGSTINKLAEEIAPARVLARVKASNIPSRRIFESLGFHLSETEHEALLVFEKTVE